MPWFRIVIHFSPTYPPRIYSTTTTMNTARAGRVGVNRFQLFQLAGSLDAVVFVVGEYPEICTSDRCFDQFVAHVLADPQAERGQLSADQYQFTIEEPDADAYYIVDCMGRGHTKRTKFWDCSFKCGHAPLPSLFPNLNYTTFS